MTALLPAKVYTIHEWRKSIYKKHFGRYHNFYVSGLKKGSQTEPGTLTRY